MLAAVCPGASCFGGTTADGTGPGIVGGVEKSGRASSRNEKAGMAEESTTPKAPGTAGAGGCGDCASCTGGTSAGNEKGIARNPSSLGTASEKLREGVGRSPGSSAGSTNSGRASARNANDEPASGSRRPPGTAGRGAEGAGERRSGTVFLSGVATNAAGCASVNPANSPGTAGAVGLGTAA